MSRVRSEWLERAVRLPELRHQAERHPVALKAQGARIYDVDNVGYIDYLGGGGSAIAGFGNQFIVDAARKVLAAGVPDGLHVPQEVELAESLSQVVPWAEVWWLARHHDESMRRLLLWARHVTGKELFLMLDGGARLRCGATSLDPPGRSRSTVREVRGWDVARIEAAITAGASKVAALIVDPLMTRCGVIPAPKEALQRIGEACRRAGILLVFDERITGFRVDRGGAAAWAEVEPDAAVYGNALGGGFPIGAVALREEFSGPPPVDEGASLPPPHAVSLAAAEAVLSIVKNNTIYERLEERTAQLVDGVLALAERFSRPMVVNRVGSVFALYMTREPVDDCAGADEADATVYQRFVDGLRAEGVLLPQEPSGTAFVSSSHGAKDIDETLDACERVLLRLHQEDMP